jgi:hypothetical protein
MEILFGFVPIQQRSMWINRRRHQSMHKCRCIASIWLEKCSTLSSQFVAIIYKYNWFAASLIDDWLNTARGSGRVGRRCSRVWRSRKRLMLNSWCTIDWMKYLHRLRCASRYWRLYITVSRVCKELHSDLMESLSWEKKEETVECRCGGLWCDVFDTNNCLTDYMMECHVCDALRVQINKQFYIGERVCINLGKEYGCTC